MDPQEHAPQPPLPVQVHEHVALPCIVDMDPPEHAPLSPLPVLAHEYLALPCIVDMDSPEHALSPLSRYRFMNTWPYLV
jgi:hypothetical protein